MRRIDRFLIVVCGMLLPAAAQIPQRMEHFIAEKIKNCLELKYPPGKLKFLIITDGSTDRTVEIVTRYPQIQLLHQDTRAGKIAAG